MACKGLKLGLYHPIIIYVGLADLVVKFFAQKILFHYKEQSWAHDNFLASRQRQRNNVI